MWRTGLRISEALALQIRDIDRGSSSTTIRVRHGKGDRSRTVSIGVDAAAYLEAWIEARRKYSTAVFLFCRIRKRDGKNDRLSSSAVRKMLSALGDRAGIEKRIHAHGLRHTFALELDGEGVPLRVIQQALGHAAASTTSNYLSALGSREVLGVLSGRKI